MTPELWLVHLWAPPEREARLHAQLEPAEQGRVARFAFPWLRTRFTVAHAALRTIAARHGAGPPARQRWASGPHGKPYLSPSGPRSGSPSGPRSGSPSGPRSDLAPDRGLELNLSHAGDWALIAVGFDRPVGVDLEAIVPDRVSPSMVRMVTSPAERAVFATLPPSEHAAAFFRLWVRKEAVIKALGTGLTRGLDTIDVPLTVHAPADGVRLRPPPPDGTRLWLWDLPAPIGYLAALVVEQPEGEAPRPPGPLGQLTLDDLDPRRG